MRPEVMAQTSDAVSIQSGNADATKFVNPAIANDPAIFPPPAVEATLYAITVASPEIDRLRTRLWTKIKTNR
jgi:putrescine transport system substrate-binding protein